MQRQHVRVCGSSFRDICRIVALDRAQESRVGNIADALPGHRVVCTGYECHCKARNEGFDGVDESWVFNRFGEGVKKNAQATALPSRG